MTDCYFLEHPKCITQAEDKMNKGKAILFKLMHKTPKASKQKSKSVTGVQRGKQNGRLNRCCDKGEDRTIYTQRIIREVETAEGIKHGCRQC